MFLTESEVVELTHKTRRSSQIHALRSMGIEHKIRPNGTVAVSRAHVEKIFHANVSENVIIKEEWQPDWKTVR